MSEAWEMNSLEDVAYMAGRIGWKGLTKKEYTSQGPYFLSVHGLNYGDFVDFRDAFHISQERYDESPEIMLQSDDVLLCKDGAGIGKVGIVDDLPGPSTINSSLLLIRAGENLIPKFLYYNFLGPYFQRIVQDRIDGATTPHLYQKDIKTFLVPVPPVPEQQRIVSILDEAFGAIDRAKAIAEQNLANAKELFESYLNRVFTEKGEGWEEKTIVDVCERLHQGLNTAGQKIKFHDSGFPIIQTRNINDGGIDLEDKIKFMSEDDWNIYRDKYRPDVGDVFFTNIGTIGKTAVVSNSMDYLIHWNIFKLRPKHDIINSNFLKCTLDYLTQTGFFQRLQKGGTVDFVTKKMISDAVFHLPPISRQQELVAEINVVSINVENLVSTRNQAIAALDELKQSILQKAFTGQLTAKSPELEAV